MVIVQDILLLKAMRQMPPGSLPTNEDPLVLGRQNYMVYSLRDLIISCVAIDWNLELKSNFCIPLTFAMDNDDDNDDDAHNAVATVLGSQFGRERENGQRIRPAIHVD